MKDMMTHKGFVGSVHYSDEDRVFYGKGNLEFKGRAPRMQWRKWVASALIGGLLQTGCAVQPVTLEQRELSSKREAYRYDFSVPESDRTRFDIQLMRSSTESKLIEKQVVYRRGLSSLGWMAILGLSGGLGYGGYQVIQEGLMVIGRELIGAGVATLILPPIMAQKEMRRETTEDEIWEESEPQPVRSERVRVQVGERDFVYITDEEGRIRIGLGALVGLWDGGEDLPLRIELPDVVMEGPQVPQPKLSWVRKNPQRLLGETGKPSLPPYPRTTLSMMPRNGMVWAGEKMYLTLRIENTGKGAFYKLLGQTASSSPYLDQARFYLGEIQPGGWKEYTVVIQIPRDEPEGDKPFEISFIEHNDFPPDPVKNSIYVRELPRPQLICPYQVIDDNSGSSVGNGDGIIQKGEAADLLLTVKNIGGGRAEDVWIKLSAPQREGLEINVAEQPLGDLEPGDFKTCRLTFTVKKTMPGNQIPLHLAVGETAWDVSLDRDLELPLAEILAPEIIPLRRNMRVMAEEAEMFGGAREETGIIARVEQGGDLLVTGQLGEWYRVEVEDDLKGWIRAQDLELKSEAAAAQPTRTPGTIVRVFDSPPHIALFSPEKDQIQTTAKTLMIEGLVTDDKGIARVEIKVNGRVQEGSKGLFSPSFQRGGPKVLKIKEAVPLVDGRNIVSIWAYDVDSLSARKDIIVRRSKELPEIWAAIIGISDYQYVTRLKYADDDARAFYEYLLDLGVPEDHITLLLDEQAYLENVKRVLGEELRRKAGIEDQVILYFSGHGAVQDDPSSPDGDGLGKYLLTYKSQPASLYSTAIPMDEIARIFGMIRSERVVYIGDTCFSGASGGRTVLAQSTRGVLADTFWERLSRGKGRIILSASGSNELSIENSRIGHGVFTFHLLEGLRGKADFDGDGFITVDEAYDYVYQTVPDATGQLQHPVKKGEYEGEIILGRVVP